MGTLSVVNQENDGEDDRVEELGCMAPLVDTAGAGRFVLVAGCGDDWSVLTLSEDSGSWWRRAWRSAVPGDQHQSAAITSTSQPDGFRIDHVFERLAVHPDWGALAGARSARP